MYNYQLNSYNTTDLTLNIMARIARQLDLDIEDDRIADELYLICSHLESWPEGEGFGSSDSYGEHQEAMRVFHIPAPKPWDWAERCDKCKTRVGEDNLTCLDGDSALCDKCMHACPYCGSTEKDDWDGQCYPYCVGCGAV